ncbi:hypothetical protein MCEKH37_01191 [Methylophilaceae bacterium]
MNSLKNIDKAADVFGESNTLVTFSPFALWSPHFETELEIIQIHLDRGGDVLMLSCNGKLKICEPNPEHDFKVCAMCKSRFNSGVRWLNSSKVSVEPFFSLTKEQQRIVRRLNGRTWNDISEVKSFSIDGVDIGLSAISSVVSQVRDSEPNVEEHQDIIKKHIDTSASVYFSLKNKIGKKNIDSMLIFNGRFSSLRPLLRLAQQHGTPISVHERGGTEARYSLTKNTYPHDLKVIKDEVELIYHNSIMPEIEKYKIASAWFEERKAGAHNDSFARYQQNGLLPEKFNIEVINLIIFNSSEDEFLAIEEWKNPHYSDQNEAIIKLLDDIKDEERIHVYLRVHPNLKDLNNTQTRGIELIKRKYKNFHVISAESPVSSYALIDLADIILTYGSTVGIEASYAGKTSILMGRAIYEDLNVCIKPETHKELILILRQISAGVKYPMPSDCQVGLIKYGLFQKLWGVEYKYLKPLGFTSAQMIKEQQSTFIKVSFSISLIINIYLFTISRTTKLKTLLIRWCIYMFSNFKGRQQ